MGCSLRTFQKFCGGVLFFSGFALIPVFFVNVPAAIILIVSTFVAGVICQCTGRGKQQGDNDDYSTSFPRPVYDPLQTTENPPSLHTGNAIYVNRFEQNETPVRIPLLIYNDSYHDSPSFTRFPLIQCPPVYSLRDPSPVSIFEPQEIDLYRIIDDPPPSYDTLFPNSTLRLDFSEPYC